MNDPNDTAFFDEEPGASEAESQQDFAAWWAQLPDFIKPDYPLDLPPARMPFAKFVFTDAGAPPGCPQAACRRSGECEGGDGPTCYRADRRFFSRILFLW
jgi:hypothetical protein